MIVIADNSPEIIMHTEVGYFWGSNLAYAAEFDNKTAIWRQVPRRVIREREWETIELPKTIEKQKKLARMYNLTWDADYDLGPFGDLKMKKAHPNKYFYIKEIIKDVGICNSQLKEYSKIVGSPIINPDYDELVNPGGVGRKRFLYSAHQVNEIFKIRLKDPKLCHKIVGERYERWLLNLEG